MRSLYKKGKLEDNLDISTDKKQKCTIQKCKKTRKRLQKEYNQISIDTNKKCGKIKHFTRKQQCSMDQLKYRPNLEKLKYKHEECVYKKCKRENNAIQKIKSRLNALP